MTDTPSNLDQAIRYARAFGWAVFPLHSIQNGKCTCGKACSSPGKHPIASFVPHGVSDATKDENIIRTWFSSRPGALTPNIGIATGTVSGLIVVDLDIDKGADIETIALSDERDEFLTPTVRTGGGTHFYYKLPDGEIIKNSQGKLAPFVDIRSEGGYVVAPPSAHISGNVYEFVDETETLLEFPQEWIIQLAAKPAVNHANGDGNGSSLVIPPPNGYEVPESVLTGGRNAALASMAGKLRYIGLDRSAIEAAILTENKRICVPPLEDAEVRKIAASIARNYEPAVEIPVYTPDSAPPKTIENWDDVSISKLFCEEHEKQFRFCAQAKKWIIWTSTHWEFDEKNIIKARATEFSQGLYTRVLSLVANPSDMKTAHKQILKSNSVNGLNAFLELSKSFLAVSTDELDRDPYLLNCQNGTVDLRTGKLSPHDPADFITKLVPYDFDAAAQTHHFDKFLQIIQPDPNIRKFIQQSIGYSLLGIARERTFFILYGNGNNGKSVFIDLWSEILRDYSSSVASASVMASKTDRIPNDIARLRGKRFVVIPETEENERLNAALIKSLSAGDKVTARFLFGEFFDFWFSGKLWIATNHKPTITDHSKGFWDRLKLIPFTVDIPKTSVIKRDTLLSNLLSEAPAILAWAVRGVTEYFQADRLEVPKVIQDEIDAYKYEQDSIAQFIDEACTTDETAGRLTVENRKLYNRYKEFCLDNGEYVRSQRRFTQNLKERGFSQFSGHSSRMWQGIDLKY